MSAAYASAGGYATPIIASRSVPERQPEGGRCAGDAPRIQAAADASLRAAGAVTVGEA